MKKMLSFSIALALLPLPLAAHEEFRSVGVIAKRYANSDKMELLELKSQDGNLATLWISKQTVVKQDDKTIGNDALKAGATVVIDSWGDTYDYSEILTARIVPAIPAAK